MECMNIIFLLLLFFDVRVNSFRLPPRHSRLDPSTAQGGRSNPIDKGKEARRKPFERHQHQAGSFDTSPTIMLMCSSRQHAAITMFSKVFSRTGSAACTAPTLLRGGAAVMAGAVGAPKLVTWIGPALACATSYALYNLFIKKASSSIDPILGGVLLQFVAALIGSALLLLQTAATKGGSTLQITKLGLVYSVAAGCAVGAAEILSFIISGMGVEATQSIPIVVGGSIVVGTMLGAVWLRERLTMRGWLGVLLIAIGIALVGMDPGSGMGH